MNSYLDLNFTASNENVADASKDAYVFIYDISFELNDIHDNYVNMTSPLAKNVTLAIKTIKDSIDTVMNAVQDISINTEIAKNSDTLYNNWGNFILPSITELESLLAEDSDSSGIIVKENIPGPGACPVYNHVSGVYTSAAGLGK